MSKKRRIEERNSRPFITVHLDGGPIVVTLPQGATKSQVRLILQDAACLMGVSL